MTANHLVPEGFEPADLGPGFSAAFGPVYRHRTQQKLGFRVEARHLNPVDVCHGGAMATFADMLIVVVHSGAGSRDGHSPTITMSIDYVGPARAGTWVEGDVMLVKATRTMLFVQSLITADGEIVARTNGIYRRYPQAAPS